MSWVNFGLLGVGGALLSVPVIIHFLMQPKPKEMVFPALRFLKEKQHANRSRSRIRHFLLLLIRCLLIGLLALALAGPSVASNDFGNWIKLGGIGFSGLIVGGIFLLSFFRSKKNPVLLGILGVLLLGHLAFGAWAGMKVMNSETVQIIGDDQAPVAALIVIDTSARMEYRRENQTRLDKAKEVGQWLVGQLPVDSQVCVVATDFDRPFFSVDVAAAGRRIETLETTYVSNSIPAALSDGIAVLEKAVQERKEIYIVTDLTRQSWVGEKPKVLLKQLERNETAGLFVVDVGVEDATNFSLSQLELSELEITPNGRLLVTTELKREGDAGQRTVKMSVEKRDNTRPVVRDGRTIYPEATFDGQVVTKDVRENSSAPLKFSFSEPLSLGVYHGKVEIEGQDSLDVDNRRFFTISVGTTKNVLAVHPEGVNPKIISSLLAPREKVDAGTSRYLVDTMNQETFQAIQEGFENYDSIFLLDPAPASDSFWSKLEQYVQDGGGLAIFLGYNAANGAFADPSFTTPAAKRVLGGELERQWASDSEVPDLFLSPKELTHPIFKLIRNAETSILWNRFPIFFHWGIQPDEFAEELPTQTLLRYGNLESAVIERQIGQGKVLVMTTPVTEYGNVEGRPSWNALFTGRPVPAYLLMRGISMYLSESDTDSLNVNVGSPATFRNELREYPETYQVFSPTPDKEPTRLNSNNNRIRYRFTDAPGHYRMRGIFEDEVLMRGFSANLDQSTTELVRINPDELDGFLGAERYQLATDKTEIQRQQGESRRGQEFYPLVVIMMLIVLAVEYLMSNRFYAS